MNKVVDIPKGHKLTKAGIIPADWTSGKVSDLFDFISSYSNSRSELTEDSNEGTIKYIHYGDIHSKFDFQVIDIRHEKIPYLRNVISNGKDFKFLQDGDVVLADASEDYKGIAECVELKSIGNQKIIGGLHTIVLRDKNNYTSLGFRSYVFSNHSVRKILMKIATGISVYGISKGNLSKVFIPLPPINEQKKISKILSVWDGTIYNKDRLLKCQIEKRKGLEQQLLSGQIRFKEFVKSEKNVKTKVGVLPEEWKLKSISDIVDKIKVKLAPEPETLYREIGIRSHCKGIFHKEEVTGKSLGNKSVFWIQPDCFVVNIVFAWEHAIAKTTESEVGMIASHRFPLYKPKADILDLDYLLYYFKTARGKHLLGLASPGGAGRNKTLGQTEFAKLKIPVPSLEEQKRIVSVLSESDKEIELLKQHIDILKEQKKGLMQKLLTGEIRVNTDKE